MTYKDVNFELESCYLSRSSYIGYVDGENVKGKRVYSIQRASPTFTSWANILILDDRHKSKMFKTGGQYDSSTTLERVALNFCPESLNIFVADFCCGDIIVRVTVALGRRPMSEIASKVLQQKPGGQETLPRHLSDNKILFEWCCPPVSGFLMPPPSPSAVCETKN